MKKPRVTLIIILLVIFLAGIGIIAYQSRPVMDLETSSGTETSTQTTGDTQTPTDTTSTDTTNNQTDTTTSDIAMVGEYTMTDVEAHASSSDCWAAIDGNVYDLSDWVSRHPGGPEAIISLCGTDGSEKFNGQHAGFAEAESALFLLKIGTLNE